MARNTLVRVPLKDTPVDRRLLAGIALLALGSCALTLLSGVATALTYTSYEPLIRSMGWTLQHLRPVHESGALAWIFLGGVACVHLYLRRTCGPATAALRRAFAAEIALWTVAGIGITVSLLGGHFSGKEYFGYHPIFSLPILVGWLLFAWSFFSQVGFSLRGRPVYLYMWTVALPLFVITYLEGHLYLLEQVSSQPVWDISIQWKAWGTLGGSFNLLAYGALMYTVGLVRGDDSYARSRTAFALLGVSFLNIFTNYGHHTYHLPQSSWIHWISFLVTMLELILLAKVFLDVLKLLAGAAVADSGRLSDRFFRSATLWTLVMLALALSISVPPVNALIHGTHVVVTHSMGSMIGIDSMILWGALAYLVLLVAGEGALAGRRVLRAIPLLNAFLAVFLFSYLAHGIAVGWQRYAGSSAPDLSQWRAAFPGVMTISGLGLAVMALWIVGHWMWALLRRVALSD